MEYKLKKNNDATVQITIRNTPREVETAFQGAYEKARNNLKLPGFRKGKAPVELVAKHLGDSVANDAARALIADTLSEILQNLDPPPITMPAFDVEEFDRNKGAVYTGSYDTVPEVKIGKYRKIKVTVDEPKVRDEDVEGELKRLQSENALLKTREDEGALADDRVALELDLLDGETSLYRNESYEVQIGGRDLLRVPELADRMTGKKTGEDLEFETRFEPDHADANLAGKKVLVRAKVKEIRFNELPALDDEFARDLGTYETLDALKIEIRQKIQDHLDNHVRGRATREILKAIVDDSKIVIPRSLVENEFNRRVGQIQQRYGKEMSLEAFARAVGQEPDKLSTEFREAALKSVQEEVILLEVSKKEKIEVRDAEIEQELKKVLGEQFPADRMRELLDKKEVRDDIKSRLMYRKTVDWLFDNANRKTGTELTLDKVNPAADLV